LRIDREIELHPFRLTSNTVSLDIITKEVHKPFLVVRDTDIIHDDSAVIFYINAPKFQKAFSNVVDDSSRFLSLKLIY